jgi:hypothetical protein
VGVLAREELDQRKQQKKVRASNLATVWPQDAALAEEAAVAAAADVTAELVLRKANKALSAEAFAAEAGKPKASAAATHATVQQQQRYGLKETEISTANSLHPLLLLLIQLLHPLLLLLLLLPLVLHLVAKTLPSYLHLHVRNLCMSPTENVSTVQSASHSSSLLNTMAASA